MERASFIFQIFFESATISESTSNNEFAIGFRLFQLPMIEVCRKAGPAGRFDLSIGKRMTLKMPYVEILDECPLFLLIRSPRPGRTGDRTPPHRLTLQSVFGFALRTPGRYIRQHFDASIATSNGRQFATIQFTVSICYISSTQNEAAALPPITLPTESSVDDDVSQKTIQKVKRDVGIMTREFPPPVPDSRRRTIFYFDRAELMEENKALATEIRELTAHVQQLKAIIGEHGQRGTKHQKTEMGDRKQRTDYIYHPPGLELTKRTRTLPR
jgi:hypothetical protein